MSFSMVSCSRALTPPQIRVTRRIPRIFSTRMSITFHDNPAPSSSSPYACQATCMPPSYFPSGSAAESSCGFQTLCLIGCSVQLCFPADWLQGAVEKGLYNIVTRCNVKSHQYHVLVSLYASALSSAASMASLALGRGQVQPFAPLLPSLCQGIVE